LINHLKKRQYLDYPVSYFWTMKVVLVKGIFVRIEKIEHVNMNITYKTDVMPTVDDVIEVYDNSGLVRPTTDKERIGQMFNRSNLVVTAWDGNQLVGIARSLTDFCYCCYLSDLAVKKDYQHAGIGKQLVHLTKEVIGDKTMLLLLAAPSAMEYYPKIGMDTVDNGFIIKRIK